MLGRTKAGTGNGALTGWIGSRPVSSAPFAGAAAGGALGAGALPVALGEHAVVRANSKSQSLALASERSAVFIRSSAFVSR
jgi:hypothetical protein